MAGICFFFEPSDVDVWSGHNLDAWNLAAQAAGDITGMIVINRTQERLTTPNSDLTLFDVRAIMPPLRNAVYVVGPNERQPNTASLWTFPHDCDWYVFGPAAGWGQRFDRTITIPQAGRGALHAVHVATPVMLHRFATLRGDALTQGGLCPP